MTYPPLLNLSAAPRDTLRADRVRSSRLSRSSLTLATLDDLFAKAEQPFDDRLRPRRAARDIYVDWYDGVATLERGVAVPNLAARGRAVAHSDDPLRLGHLLVETAEARRHFVGDRPCHDHHVGLPRARAENLHAEPRGVMVCHRGRNHFDRAAREPITEWPGGPRPGPVHEVVHGGENDVVVVREDARRR